MFRSSKTLNYENICTVASYNGQVENKKNIKEKQLHKTSLWHSYQLQINKIP